jgi:hypothetical protein
MTNEEMQLYVTYFKYTCVRQLHNDRYMYVHKTIIDSFILYFIDLTICDMNGVITVAILVEHVKDNISVGVPR